MRVVSRKGNDKQPVNIVSYAREYLTDARIGRWMRWMIIVVLLIISTRARSGNIIQIMIIFVLTANSGWAFHKDDPHFPLFEEMLLFLIKIGGVREMKVDEPCSIFQCSL